MPDHDVQRRQRMVQPATGKPHGNDEIGANMAQRLGEIGAVLLGHMDQPGRTQPVARGIADGIEIPDRQIGDMTQGKRSVRAPIRRDQNRRKIQRLRQILGRDGTAADQRDAALHLQGGAHSSPLPMPEKTRLKGRIHRTPSPTTISSSPQIGRRPQVSSIQAISIQAMTI